MKIVPYGSTRSRSSTTTSSSTCLGKRSLSDRTVVGRNNMISLSRNTCELNILLVGLLLVVVAVLPVDLP